MSYRQVAHVVFVILFVLMLYIQGSLTGGYQNLVNSLVFASMVEIIFWSFDELIRKP